jgi:hypothetical protein
MDKDEEGVDLIEVCGLDEIPQFATEAEEAAWWSTHELSAELWRRYGHRVGDSLVLELPAGKSVEGRRHGERRNKAG